MIIRPATRSDLAAINELMRRSSAYDGEYRAILDGYRVTPEQLARDAFRIAELEGDAAGFFSLASGPPVELDLMFGNDRFQGAGIGAALFQDMRRLAWAMGAAEIRIVSHPPSAGFYERMGAVRVGEKPPAGRITWSRPVLTVTSGSD